MRKQIKLFVLFFVLVGISLSAASINLESESFTNGFKEGQQWRQSNRVFPVECGEKIKSASDLEAHFGFVAGWANIVETKLKSHLKRFVKEVGYDSTYCEGFLNGFAYRARNTGNFFQFPQLNQEVSESIRLRVALGYLHGMAIASDLHYQGNIKGNFEMFYRLIKLPYAFKIGYAKAMFQKGSNIWKARDFKFYCKELEGKPRETQIQYQLGYFAGWWYLGSYLKKRLDEAERVLKATQNQQEGWLSGFCIAIRFSDKFSKDYLAWAKNNSSNKTQFEQGFNEGFNFFNPDKQTETEVEFLSNLSNGGLQVATPDTDPSIIDASNLIFHYQLIAISYYYMKNEKDYKRLEKMAEHYAELVKKQLELNCTRAIDNLISEGTETRTKNLRKKSYSPYGSDKKNEIPSDTKLLKGLAQVSITIMNGHLAENNGLDRLNLKAKINFLKKF
jgi:hypothetical protein